MASKVMRGLVLPTLALALACQSNSFRCEDDSECTVQGVAGRCEDNGVCSFPDEECSSGRRYGQQAPTELAGVCVESSGGASTGFASSEGGSSDPGTTSGATTTSTESSSGPSTSTSSTGWESSSSTGDVSGPQPNIVFVASQPVPETDDLIGAADELCNNLAQDAGLPGGYLAWLSTDDIGAIERLRGARGWVRTDGRPFADRPSDIIEGRIFYPPLLDELGAEVRNRRVLTGTSAVGMAAANCEDWTPALDTAAAVGEPGATYVSWTVDGTMACEDIQSLGTYCFGVEQSVPVGYEPQDGRHAFVTTSVFSGSAGLSTFDNACMMEASAAGLSGTYLAVVATSTASALSRFDTSGPLWVNMLGVPLAETAAALTVVSHLDAPINLTATGEPVTGAYWVGSDLPTTAGTETCGDWTGMGMSVGRVYDTEYTTDWFDEAQVDCSGMRRVLCFEE